jgi:adenylate cyclase
VALSDKEKRAIEKLPTADVRACDFYLRSRQFFYQLRRNSFDYARQMFQRAIEIDPAYARAIYLGAGSLLQLGEPEKGLEWARRALQMDPEEPSILYNVACVYALQGAIEEAIECLEGAVKFGFGHKEWIQNDSDLDVLRSHPCFQALLERLG